MKAGSKAEDIMYRALGKSEGGLYRSIRLEALKLEPDSFSAVYAEQLLNPKMRFEKEIENENPAAFVLGAFQRNELLGIAGFVDTNEWGLPDTGTLIQMYVRAGARGQGIGLGLTQGILRAASTKDLILEVKRTNPGAQLIYERAGFKVMEIAALGGAAIDPGLKVMLFSR